MGKNKVRIRFDAAPPARLVIDEKTQVEAGKEISVDEEVARGLLEWADVSLVDATLAPRWPQAHAQLDALADKIGVQWPAPAEGKSTLSVAEKQAQLEEAGFTPESAAAAADGTADLTKEND